MKPERVREYVALVRRVCARHGMPPLITMTSLSDRLLDGTVPLLFDRMNDAATARAEACYRALFDEGRREGFLPYRVSSQNMHLIVDREQPFWHMVRQLKRAADPAGILAPGRYCPLDDPSCDAEAAIPARGALRAVCG
jgi:4-cresol dehydrogenase (hydroxylating)